MSKANKFLIIITIVLVLITIGLAVYMFLGQNKKNEVYSAVYLESGDIYFGKLHIFPKMHLTNIYLLQQNNDPQTSGTTPYILSKFADSMWGPKDYLSLNRDKIIWIGKLENDSPVVKAIDNPSAYLVTTTTTTSPAIPGTTLNK
jgi:hypothetical protein